MLIASTPILHQPPPPPSPKYHLEGQDQVHMSSMHCTYPIHCSLYGGGGGGGAILCNGWAVVTGSGTHEQHALHNILSTALYMGEGEGVGQYCVMAGQL